ncbi:MAG: sulfatase-like hydrolase/transferase [Beijerinckiaceae bacterium]
MKPRHALSPLTARLAAAGLALALGAYLAATEGEVTNIHALAVTGALAAALAALTRRPLLAVVAVGAAIVLILATAHVKRLRSDFILHAWDLFDVAQWGLPVDWIAREAQLAGAALAGALLALLIAAPLLWRLEPPHGSRALAGVGALACAALAAFAADLRGEPRHTQYTWADRNLSSFYSSWPETIEALARGALLETGPRAAPGALAPAGVCAPAEKPPHIILIHQESVTPPGALPGGLAYDRALDDFFLSHDGLRHAMRVETYGGGSWLTEFSALTGMSSRFFGGMQHFVQVYMAGRVSESLPATLARCGYRTAMFYPYLKGYFGSSRFFESIGLSEIFDLKAQGAKTAMEQDRFYYANALAEIDRHLQASRKPLFLYVQTMAAHWPYDVTYWPERQAAGAGAASGGDVHPEMREYLRRLAMARADFEEMKAALAARFPGERFLIMHYGDHHPLATRGFFGFGNEEIEEINRRLPESSPAFVTYYASLGVNYAPPPMPRHETLDAAYLGAVLLEQARLPAPDSWRARADLMRACEGRYAACPDRARVLAFHRKLVDSGIVRAR